MSLDLGRLETYINQLESNCVDFDKLAKYGKGLKSETEPRIKALVGIIIKGLEDLEKTTGLTADLHTKVQEVKIKLRNLNEAGKATEVASTVKKVFAEILKEMSSRRDLSGAHYGTMPNDSISNSELESFRQRSKYKEDEDNRLE